MLMLAVLLYGMVGMRTSKLMLQMVTIPPRNWPSNDTKVKANLTPIIVNIKVKSGYNALFAIMDIPDPDNIGP